MRETTIYLSEQVGAALDQLAAQTGQSPEMIVTHAVVSYLQAQVHATPPSPNPQASLSLSQRRAFLKLPQEQRRRILQAQAENLTPYYETDPEWRELQTGDLIAPC